MRIWEKTPYVEFMDHIKKKQYKTSDFFLWPNRIVDFM